MSANNSMLVGTLPLGYRPVENSPAFIDVRAFVILIVLFSLIGVAAWVSFAKLDSATSAKGQLRVETHRKTIKALESGVVRRLMVAEGDKVLVGQPLIELDPTRASANVDIFRQRYLAAQAQYARYQAEVAGKSEIVFPPSLMAQADDANVRAAMSAEIELFETNMLTVKARRDVVKSSMEQLAIRVASTENQIMSTREQINLSSDELKSVEFLLEKDLIQKSRYLSVRRQHIALKGRLSELEGHRAELQQAIGAAQVELLDIDEQVRNVALNRIVELQSQLIELEKQLGSASNTLEHFTLRSPQEGTVVNLEVFNEGQIVFGGESVMDIIPNNDQLIIEAKIMPDDINNVTIGMLAKVRISALNVRTTPLLKGSVSLVSADLTSPPDTEKTYYSATIVLPAEQVEKLGDIELYPGMQAQVMIVKGERTVLDYLLSPLALAAESAMREP
ncbi:MAG: HlyD family type I secretion periplasmic adaptor subunit [Alphaproteobacteria bacterium]|nr:HlyD family type I secretion periplasmic adaptor subunit [Alphaproteobacteria bacterium]